MTADPPAPGGEIAVYQAADGEADGDEGEIDSDAESAAALDE